MKDSWERWASLCATTDAPSTDPMVPAATSNTAAVNQTRRGLLIGPTLSTLMPNGREDWGTVVTLTGYGPSKTPLTIPEINNRLKRTFEVRHQYYSTIAKNLGHPQGP